jgi:Fe-S cluster assembly ATP-binding protein
MLTIKNVSATIDNKNLLSNISIQINSGEIHAILGPRQSGKSTLAHLIAGYPTLDLTEGSILFNGKNLKTLNAENRAKLGIYVAFQGPPEIGGLTNFELALNCLRAKKDKILEEDILKDYSVLADMLELPSTHGNSIIHFDDISPIDMKKNEILLMLLLEPKLVIIDEIDSGMDENDLEILGAILSSFSSEKNSIILITHSRKLLDMVVPTNVHVLVNGEIREQGTTELYKRIIEDGYSQFS